MVTLAALLIPLFALWLWWPLTTLSRGQRAFAVLLTALLGVSPALLLGLLNSGTLAYPTVARLQVPSGWALACLLLLVPCVLLRDLAWLATRLAGHSACSQRLHAGWPTCAALLLAMGVSAWGVHNALQPPQVREHTLYLPSLPPGLDGLRVAVLSDIHASPVNDAQYVHTIVQRTLAAKPHLIVLPGDLVDGDIASNGANVAPLAQLRAPLGVWVAPGNHEYYSGYDAWMSRFADLGLFVLANQTQLLELGDARLALSGIGDPVYGHTSHNNANPTVPEGVPPDVAAVTQQARADGADFQILLAHQPKFAHDNAAHGVGLQISGHTHGGQIRGMDRWLVAPANNGFVRGAYNVDGMRLWVSSGAGLWAGFAVRLGVPPAIDLLVLRRGTAPTATR